MRFDKGTTIIAKTSYGGLVDTGGKHGMEINIDKSQDVRVSRTNELQGLKSIESNWKVNTSL